MATYLTNDTDLGAVADAIRTKGGTSADLVFPGGFVDAVHAIEADGGGGDFEGLSVIKKIELIEPVRAVKIDIPSGYDWVYVLINGEFTAEDWLYWGINSETSGLYMAKTASILTGFVATNRPQGGTGVMTGFRYNDAPYDATVDSPMEYIHLRGYAKDFTAGTKFYAYGGKYADM